MLRLTVFPVSSTTQKPYLLATMASKVINQITKPMKIIKNMTNVPMKNDLYDYYNWLGMNYGIIRTTRFFQQYATTPAISHEYSMYKIKSDSLYYV